MQTGRVLATLHPRQMPLSWHVGDLEAPASNVIAGALGDPAARRTALAATHVLSREVDLPIEETLAAMREDVAGFSADRVFHSQTERLSLAERVAAKPSDFAWGYVIGAVTLLTKAGLQQRPLLDLADRLRLRIGPRALTRPTNVQ